MTLTAKGRLACAALLNIEGLVAVVYANPDTQVGFKSYAYDETGRFLCDDGGMFKNPFAYAENQVKTYSNHTLTAVLFDPKDEECPPVLRSGDGIAYSGDWQKYAIARFQFEQAEKDREEKRQYELAKAQLRERFALSLQTLGIPADKACVILHDTTFTDKEDPGSLPEYLPAFEIEGLTFVHTLGDRERLVGLLNTPADIALATKRLDADMRIIKTPAELGAALSMNGEPAK